MELTVRLNEEAPHAHREAYPEMTLKSVVACVKATSRSSTARPQEKEANLSIIQARHARACPGHPCLDSSGEKSLDGRDKPGHDEG
jgi:hypothetical protein